MAPADRSAWQPSPDPLEKRHLGLLRIIVSPMLAWWIFASRSPYPSGPTWLAVVARLRNVIAAVVVLGAALYWDPSSIAAYPTDSINALSNAGLISIGIVTAVCVVAGLLVRRGSRRIAARALCRPLLRIAVLIAVLLALRAFGIIVFDWEPDAIAELGATAPSGPLTLNDFAFSAVRNIVTIWTFAFLATAIVLVSGSMFGVGDAHPRLGALAAIALTAVLLVLSLLSGFGVAVPVLLDSGGATLPEFVAVLFTAIGVATTVALSVLEFRWWGRQGFRIRDGQWR